MFESDEVSKVEFFDALGPRCDDLAPIFPSTAFAFSRYSTD